jgi:hypothetical protein
MKQFSDQEIKDAEAELARVRKEWLSRSGVTAVDVGYRITAGRMRDELAIRVHVRRKRPALELSKDEIFPAQLGRFGVDIIEAAYGPQSA